MYSRDMIVYNVLSLVLFRAYNLCSELLATIIMKIQNADIPKLCAHKIWQICSQGVYIAYTTKI